jgi:DNA/RNA-binding domain of Phe-tRNA-synthetase-like protein
MEIRTEKLKSIYPTALFGILKVQNFNPDNIAALDEIRQNEIARIEPVFENYLRTDFVKTEPICHYVRYFKKFKKTYLVLQQIESIFVKKHHFPETIPAVQALLLTELKYGVLVAACDTEQMKEPFSIDAADGGETYIGSQGVTITLKEDDMFLRDADGIVISNIYGQDMRTRVTDITKNIMFVIMGIDGVPRNTINSALTDLLHYLQILDRDVESTAFEIIG